MKVKIFKDNYSDSIQMLFYKEIGGKRLVAKPVKLEFEELKEGLTTGPTLTIPWDITESFLRNLAEALDNEGIKTDKDARIAGTLEATKYHLGDLRKLLKLE